MLMANEVKWIKMMVGMFDGMSFKKIKRAKIGGESYRDKLTAVWFELMDFAGKCNHDGAFVGSNEIPFTDLADIAMMLDREEDEMQLCMAFYVKEGMVAIIDNVYSLTNWSAYQNKEGLDKIREQNRLRQAKFKAKQKALPQGNVTDNVIVTLSNATDKDKERDKKEDINNSVAQKRTRFSPPTVDDVKAYCKERNNSVDAERFIDYYNSNGWMVGKNKMKDWKAAVRTWESNGYGNQRKQQPKETKQRSYDIDAFERMMYAEENPSPTAANDPRIREKGEALKQRLAE